MAVEQDCVDNLQLVPIIRLGFGAAFKSSRVSLQPKQLGVISGLVTAHKSLLRTSAHRSAKSVTCLTALIDARSSIAQFCYCAMPRAHY